MIVHIESIELPNFPLCKKELKDEDSVINDNNSSITCDDCNEGRVAILENAICNLQTILDEPTLILDIWHKQLKGERLTETDIQTLKHDG